MQQFVSSSHIIKELQGEEDFEYNYIEPVPGENDKMKDVETRDKLLAERSSLVKDYETATLEWIRGAADMAAIKTRRTELANALKEDYWRLDPYLRARSYYDRVGLINPGGKIQFYPTDATASPPLPNGSSIPEHSPDDVD
jgi:hypothetical protein